MTMDELKQVVAKIQLGDSRQVDRLVLREWQENIGDLNFEDARTAVTMHRKESTDYLQPAHIRANARRAKLARERAERINKPRAITGNVITLDLEQHNREFQAALEAHRAGKL